jgi:hypothetical protein
MQRTSAPAFAVVLPFQAGEPAGRLILNGAVISLQRSAKRLPSRCSWSSTCVSAVKNILVVIRNMAAGENPSLLPPSTVRRAQHLRRSVDKPVCRYYGQK